MYANKYTYINAYSYLDIHVWPYAFDYNIDT